MARGRGGASWAAAAPGGGVAGTAGRADASGRSATLRDRPEASGDGATPRDRATTSRETTTHEDRTGTAGGAPVPKDRSASWVGLTGTPWGAFRDRADSSWGGPALRNRAGASQGGLPPEDRTGTSRGGPAPKDRTGASWGGLTPRNRADASSWGGPALKDRSAVTPGSSTVPRSRSGAPLGGPVDQARLGTALTRLAGTPVERLLSRPELAAGQALAARGVPARTIDGFLRPLLAALLCDPELTTSSRCADLALRAFAGGRLCVPEGGAEMLPEVLAAALPPGTVHTGVRVTAVSTTSVTTAEHGEIRCRAVLVATDARAAAELLPGLRVPDFHPVTVVHHTTDDPPTTEAALLLDSDRGGPVAHTAIVSEVDPSRAPAGRALVSSTVLGPPPPDIDTAVRMHLSRLYGTSTARWETLAVHHTPTAVPVMRPPHDLRRPVRLLAGLYVCGDHRDTSTVQGALHSGHRASSAILADLGAAASMHRTDPIPTTQAA
ncbi:FAD-dependent oxidoreductase [Streptomyces prunicolor]|uniref:FAD-dependent oxidoreductase n=1 Tax=Streptomyces prunicolor TaxID=67348 RepID=UPI003F4DF0F6